MQEFILYFVADIFFYISLGACVIHSKQSCFKGEILKRLFDEKILKFLGLKQF